MTVRNVGELIALIKSSKEPFQVGTPGVSTVNHLAAVLFAQQAGVKLQYIPYKGSQPLITDMVGGHVKVGFNPIPVSRGALEGKLIRALAGTSLKRSSIVPGPADGRGIRPAGLRRGADLRPVAPAGTPRPIIDRLNKELRAALATDEVKRRLDQEGAEPMPTTPEEHAAVIDREETKWSALIKSDGLEGGMTRFAMKACALSILADRCRAATAGRRRRRTIRPGRSRWSCPMRPAAATMPWRASSPRR